MTKTYRLLYLEDSPEDVELLRETLVREYLPCTLAWVNGRRAFESALEEGWNYDLILADYRLPDLDGDEALALARRRCPEVPFIFVSGHMGEEKVVECLRQGATDYVLKSNPARLAPVVRRALLEAAQAAARREADAANGRMVALLRATLEATAEGILVVDLAGKVSNFNRKFMALCGIPDYVMAPMNLEGVLGFLMKQAADPQAFLAEALGGRPDRERVDLFRLNGRILEGRVGPYRVAGETLGRVYSFSDVTDRETVEGHLRGQADHLRSLLDAAEAGGAVPWFLSGGRLVLAESARALLGEVPLPEDLPHLEALIHPEDREAFHRAFEHLDRGEVHGRLRRASGPWVRTRWRLRKAQADGCHGIFLEEP